VTIRHSPASRGQDDAHFFCGAFAWIDPRQSPLAEYTVDYLPSPTPPRCVPHRVNGTLYGEPYLWQRMLLSVYLFLSVIFLECSELICAYIFLERLYLNAQDPYLLSILFRSFSPALAWEGCRDRGFGPYLSCDAPEYGFANSPLHPLCDCQVSIDRRKPPGHQRSISRACRQQASAALARAGISKLDENVTDAVCPPSGPKDHQGNPACNSGLRIGLVLSLG
jgi:hypothetical protein